MKIIVLFFFCASLIFSNQAFAIISEGKCIYVKGNVFFERAGIKEALVKNTIIKENDLIRVESNSMAILKFKHQTVKIQETSRIQISNIEEEYTKISLESGGLIINQMKRKLKDFVNEKPPLEIKTASASMGIRGTTFFAYQGDQNQTILSVKEGKVEFLAKNSNKNILVIDGNSSMSNEELKNLKPRIFGFEKEINYNLNPKKNLESGAGLKSALEATWNKYKSEQEAKWLDKKKTEESQWDQWKKSNN